MKPKPYEAQNTKFSEYQRSLLISYATFELLKFESRTDVIIEISRFLRHHRPGINEGVFATGNYGRSHNIDKTNLIRKQANTNKMFYVLNCSLEIIKKSNRSGI